MSLFRTVTILFALLALPAFVSAQQPPPPATDDEAADPGVVPVRIGPVTLTGSAWADSSFAKDNLSEGDDSFRLRRARLGLAGDLAPKIGWNISGELTSETPLRNAFVVVRFNPALNVRVGQLNPVTGLERGTSPLVLELIDRSRLTNQLTYRMDIGVVAASAAPIGGWLSYAIGLVNGSGLNSPDNNDAKDVAGRVAIDVPRIPGLTAVLSGGTGEQPEGRRTRRGLGFQYDVPLFKVLVEGLKQQQDGLDDSGGVVVIGVYRHRPTRITPHFRLLEVAVRYMVFTDPASAVDNGPSTPDEDGAEAPTGFMPATTREIQAGFNYHVNRNVRFMTNVLIPTDARTNPDATVMTRLQVAF